MFAIYAEAPIPCRNRHIIKTAKELLKPHNKDDTVKRIVPNWNIFDFPQISPKRPQNNIVEQIIIE